MGIGLQNAWECDHVHGIVNWYHRRDNDYRRYPMHHKASFRGFM